MPFDGFNLTSAPKNQAPAQTKTMFVARVTKVILGPTTKEGKIDEDFALNGGWRSVGGIKFNLVQDGNNPSGLSKSNVIAKPLFSNSKQYPLKGEFVIIIVGTGEGLNDSGNYKEPYYISTVNMWNNPHHNAFPDLLEYSNQVLDNTGDEKTTDGNVDMRWPLGDYFVEKTVTQPLRVFEGDVAYEGRHGQSIRFGSTIREDSDNNTWSTAGKTGDPITIITNRRAPVNKPEGWLPSVEDINKDGSSIWLSSGQAISIDVSKYPLDTFRLGYQAAYSPDTVRTVMDVLPSIRNIAAAEYDRKILDTLT